MKFVLDFRGYGDAMRGLILRDQMFIEARRLRICERGRKRGKPAVDRSFKSMVLRSLAKRAK